ncbi:MAG: cytochrome [Hydrocarboniphaga sp.]|uniref:cytochrome b n=1 Tax=Hydrocarboniphaga sp. TaxID=2033016 RepID=UPI00263126C6|nr:cytochrome b [Hydrocarboniphaga sp.]MDB5971238.1 cytochrome [Hydrocarboniphaga sp.]
MKLHARFRPLARLLHWSMAVLIIAMLFIGAGMIGGAPERYSALLRVHKSIGITILLLAAIRLVYRLLHPAPALPADLPRLQRAAAFASQVLLYALMFALPMVGWAMLSAEGYPILIYGGLQLPPLMHADAMWYAHLRSLHSLLGYLLFFTVLLHLGAALFHGLIRRDGVLSSMASLRRP